MEGKNKVLDIEIKSGTGFDVLNLTSNLNFEVIFTTAYDQFAIKAMKFSSLDYLLKPITFERFLKAVDKFTRLSTQTFPQVQKETIVSDYIIVKSGSKHHKIVLNNIVSYYRSWMIA